MKPRLLDLFCGAGGCSVGYARAGFEVVGVDLELQPNYPFEFWQADALWIAAVLSDSTMLPEPEYESWAGWDALLIDAELPAFDAIHASPPCQHYANVTAWRGDQADHPDLIAPVRGLLERTGLPYVIENVRTKELRGDHMLCGTMFGLPIRRHRYFETNWPFAMAPQPCQHRAEDYSFDHGAKQPESVYRDAMGCEWMTVAESREAIPPTYTEHLGSLLLAHLQTQAVAA